MAPERGFAIALLLWMIAGMSLTVAAVIHFARADIGLVETRVREAKVRAMGRGVALLILRDSAMSTGAGADEHVSDDDETPYQEGASDSGKLFSKVYQFEGGWRVDAKLRPATGLLPLNSVSYEELAWVFMELGGVGEQVAGNMVEGVMDYRYEFPGFRYREELLGVKGASRRVYDRVKHFVHPYRVGAIDSSFSPAPLKMLIQSATDSGEERGNTMFGSSGGSSSGIVEGEVTFASIHEQKRLRGGGAGLRIDMVEMTFESYADGRTQSRVWVSDIGSDPVIFTEPSIPDSALEMQ